MVLLINNWNETRKDEKYINQMLSSMTKELMGYRNLKSKMKDFQSL